MLFKVAVNNMVNILNRLTKSYLSQKKRTEEPTLTPNPMILSTVSTLNIPVNPMLIYFSDFSYMSP